MANGTSRRVAEELAEEPQETEYEQICQRAYEFYEQRGGAHGHDLEDWLQAEAEVKHTLKKPARARGTRKKPA